MVKLMVVKSAEQMAGMLVMRMVGWKAERRDECLVEQLVAKLVYLLE
jgi:hypothetical protein